MPPVLLTHPAEYPAGGYRITFDPAGLTAQMRAQALQGRVVLRVLVLADGSVGSVEVAQSSGHDALDRAAAGAAREWRFLPATRDGGPIDAWAIITVRFVVP